jgi:LacI family transcriptional regulator
MGNINIKELALKLNLSTATVSRALKDSHEISEATKQKVWALAKALNYEPNPSASNLRSQKSKTIAVIIPEVANNFFSQAINGIEEIARKRNYHVLIYQSHENFEIEKSLVKSLLNGRVDGVLISISSSSVDNQHFKEISSKIPFVFFDRFFEDFNAVKITTNDYESARQATQHLVACGCKRIAYFKALDNLCTGKKRIDGYIDSLKDHDIPFSGELMLTSCNDDDENYEQIKKLLAGQKPDGIIASIEELVSPAYYACKELNLNIPDDVKIISFSNLKNAGLLNPSLTTITQPAFEMGKEAAITLFKILDKKQVGPNETLVLESSLIKRGSTGF